MYTFSHDGHKSEEIASFSKRLLTLLEMHSEMNYVHFGLKQSMEALSRDNMLPKAMSKTVDDFLDSVENGNGYEKALLSSFEANGFGQFYIETINAAFRAGGSMIRALRTLLSVYSFEKDFIHI